MPSENGWKVLLFVAAAVAASEPTRAVSLVYQKPYRHVMFVPKSYVRSRQSRVLFLDEDESRQPLGRGEIDLTLDKNNKVKFDDSSDYQFTSPEDEVTTKTMEELPSGNERFYEPLPRFRPYQTYPSYYNGRFGRPYAPNFGFDFQPAFAPSVRTGLYNGYNGWKARSPRVVFPYASDSVNSVNAHTNSHAGPGFDNVVFREQNFGLNDVGEDQGLQDLNSSGNDAFAERDANEPHRAKLKPKALKKPMFVQTQPRMPLKRNDYLFPNATATVLPEFKPISDAQMQKMSQILTDIPRARRGRYIDTESDTQKIEPQTALKTEVPLKNRQTDRQDEKKCPQGGTCEFFFYCWMVGGLLEGSCGGLLKGCCHRVAKAGILGVQDSNSIDYVSGEQFSYGPVINDQSK